MTPSTPRDEGMNDDVPGKVSQLSHRLEQVEDAAERRALVEQLLPLMDAYWDRHPHSAMEMLECTARRLEVSLAHAFVRKVVLGWRQKPGYDPRAGGAADHCYLSALILSENYDLADQPWASEVLPRTLSKELDYSRFDRMRDGARKEAIVRGIAAGVGYVRRRG